MPRDIANWDIGRRLLGGALAVALVVAAGAAARAEEDEDTFDTRFFKGILTGLGLKGPQSDPAIEYHERSPLVVPPTRDLPPPETTGTVASPAWPNDRDVKRRTATRKQPRTSYNVEDDARQLRPEELNQRPRTASRADPRVGKDTSGQQLTPWELGFKGFSFGSLFGSKEEVVPFEREPERSSLTDPPVGYRTPSPRYPYGTTGRMEPAKAEKADQAVFGAEK